MRTLATVAAALLLAACATETELGEDVTTDGYEVTAEMIVDGLGPALRADFCDAYSVVGEAGYPSFAEGYNEEYEPGLPPSGDVWDEAVSRC